MVIGERKWRLITIHSAQSLAIPRIKWQLGKLRDPTELLQTIIIQS